MWKAVTPGEEVFLSLYGETEPVGKTLKSGGLYESLVSPERFTQFTRITAALEVLIRLLGTGKYLLSSDQSATPGDLKSAVNREGINLPPKIRNDDRFWESLRNAADHFCHEDDLRDSLKSISSNIYRAHRAQCYLCGHKITTDKADRIHHRSIDHIWPISLGGSNVPGNLLPACCDCNSKKSGVGTWAWGPVQSTRLIKSKKNPDNNLSLSLGIARMMLYAERHGTHRFMTLKDSVEKLFPACIDLKPREDRQEVYFEIFQRIEADVWQHRH